MEKTNKKVPKEIDLEILIFPQTNSLLLYEISCFETYKINETPLEVEKLRPGKWSMEAFAGREGTITCKFHCNHKFYKHVLSFAWINNLG